MAGAEENTGKSVAVSNVTVWEYLFAGGFSGPKGALMIVFNACCPAPLTQRRLRCQKAARSQVHVVV